jgi:hypothetical protein
MLAGSPRQLAATGAIVALVWVVCTPVTPAGTLASWSGRVFQPDRSAPRAGAVVELVGDEGGQRHRSQPTEADGAFKIEGAPAGRYALHVETPEGVFVSSEPVELQSGANAPMALALAARTLDAKQDHGFGGANVSRRTEYILAGVVTAVALFVYLQVTEDENEPSGSEF